jgi:hypothetical protein
MSRNEEIMKRTIVIMSFALLGAASLPAQTVTPVKNPTGAGLGKQDAATNEDMNIRAYIELLRTDLRKSKTQVMGDVMQLDADQAAKFWPVYKEFDTAYTALGDQIAALVKNYAEHYDAMTPDVADQLAQKALSIEDERNELKKKYYARMKDALDAVTAARFLQIENQLERIVDLQLAAQLPVIGTH